MQNWMPPTQSNGTYVPYVIINGRLHPERAHALREQVLAQQGATWQYAEQGPPQPDFVRLRLWQEDQPVELQISRAGNFALIAATDSPLVRWVANVSPREVKIVERYELSALLATAFVTPLAPAEVEHLQHLCIWGQYTETDRMAMKDLPWGKNMAFAYLAANVPADYTPPRDVDSPDYKREFNRLMALLTPPLQAGVREGRRIHEFMQARAVGSKRPPETVVFPAQPQELSQIRRKIVAELIPDSIQRLMADNWERTERDLQNLVLQSVSQPDLNRLTDGLRPAGVDAIEQIRQYVTEFQWNKRKAVYLNDGKCALCGFPRNQFIVPSSVVSALNGEPVPVCGVCLSDSLLGSLGTSPRAIAGRPPRPWVSTRQELVSLVRSLAEETGVLPEANLLHFLAKVPKEQLLAAIRLLWRMPYQARRKELAPEGWLSLLADAGLLEVSARTSMGIRCTAQDGDPCRSLAEKFVDDWLYARGITHEYEPAYPFDMELNSTGKRADFKVGDILIEYFGLMDQQHYAENAAIKRALAARYKIKLIELYPKDLSGAGLLRKLRALVPKQ